MRIFPPRLIFLCLLLTACTTPSSDTGGTPSGPSGASSATPRPLPDIDAMVKRLITQDGCRDFSAEMRMTAENESGKRDQVDFRIQRKYAANRTMTFLTVLAPKEETNKAILAVESADQPTQAFSYLAGLRKLAIVNSDRQMGFRGAKVTIQELLAMELGQYSHNAGERTDAPGEPSIKVEFKQKPERNLAFPRIIGFFRESDQAPERFELYNERDELQKRVTIAEVKSIQNHQTITDVSIDDLQQKLKLKLETRKIEYDSGLADSLFTEDHLKHYITSAGNRLIQ